MEKDNMKKHDTNITTKMIKEQAKKSQIGKAKDQMDLKH